MHGHSFVIVFYSGSHLDNSAVCWPWIQILLPGEQIWLVSNIVYLDLVKQIGSTGCTCYLEFVEKFISVPLTEVQAAFLLHVNMCVSNSLPSQKHFKHKEHIKASGCNSSVC